MSRRAVFTVRRLKGHGWQLVLPDKDVRECDTKWQAVKLGRGLARQLWLGTGTPSQLVIRNRDGRISNEHTYGRDPKRFPG